MTRSGLAKIILWIAIVVVVFLMPSILSGNLYWLTVLCLLAINILLVSSLRSITLINEISLGQVGFAIIGAYTHATLMMKGWLLVLAVADHQRLVLRLHSPVAGVSLPQSQRDLLLDPHSTYRRDLSPGGLLLEPLSLVARWG